MGKCLTIIKLVGVGSLGLSTAAVLFTSATISKYTQASSQEQQKVVSTGDKSSLLKLINIAKCTVLGLGSLASYLFYMAFTRAPMYERHPYLIYSALSFPVSLGLWYFTSSGLESQLKSNTTTQTVIKKQKKIVKELVPSSDEKSPLDNSTYGDLGEREPVYRDVEVEVEEPTQVTIELDDKSVLQILDDLSNGYLYYPCTALGAGLLFSLIGYLGEY